MRRGYRRGRSNRRRRTKSRPAIPEARIILSYLITSLPDALPPRPEAYSIRAAASEAPPKQCNKLLKYLHGS